MTFQLTWLCLAALIAVVSGAPEGMKSEQALPQTVLMDAERRRLRGNRTTSLVKGCTQFDSCWESMATGETCGARILWTADHLTNGDLSSASAIVLHEYPKICHPSFDGNTTDKEEPTASGTPCTSTSPCWNHIAAGQTCGDRILWTAEYVTERNLSRAADAIFREYPMMCGQQLQLGMNIYEKVPNVGAWGGWCTCPNGQRYNVGDKLDGCARGPSSLACAGGTPSKCIKQDDVTRAGRQVTCAPDTEPLANVYKKVDHDVGDWGGWCTCPDGQRYNVGDRHDSCAKGPLSLACVGGRPGECQKQSNVSRAGMLVTCAAGISTGAPNQGPTFAPPPPTMAPTPMPTPNPTPVPTPRRGSFGRYQPSPPTWSYQPSPPTWNYQPSPSTWGYYR